MLAIEDATGEIHNAAVPQWYVYEAQQMWASRGRAAPAVEIRGNLVAHGADVVIVNTLDPTYGHNIARLFAVSTAKRDFPDSKIVVICSRFMAWLVPDSVDQVWVVDAPLRELHLYNDRIAALTKDVAAKAARLRYAPIFYGHTVRIEDFSKVRPFDAATLDDVLPARITFNWREDRCLTYRGKVLPQAEAVAEQLRLVSTLLERLRREMPDLQATITGYGNHGRFADWIEDLRIVEHDSEAERNWARRYASSHLSLGMHGSNMHMPCAHAAGAIEIVHINYWGTAHETWEWVNHHKAQHALQRYLKLPPSTSLSELASIIFMQLRRMQAGALFNVLSREQDQQLRQHMTVQAFSVIQGGYPITIDGPDGEPL